MLRFQVFLLSPDVATMPAAIPPEGASWNQEGAFYGQDGRRVGDEGSVNIDWVYHMQGEHKRLCPQRFRPQVRLGIKKVPFIVKKVHPYRNQTRVMLLEFGVSS